MESLYYVIRAIQLQCHEAPCIQVIRDRYMHDRTFNDLIPARFVSNCAFFYDN